MEETVRNLATCFSTSLHHYSLLPSSYSLNVPLILWEKKEIKVPLSFAAIITLCSSLQPSGDLGVYPGAKGTQHTAADWVSLLVKNSAWATGRGLMVNCGFWSLLWSIFYQFPFPSLALFQVCWLPCWNTASTSRIRAFAQAVSPAWDVVLLVAVFLAPSLPSDLCWDIRFPRGALPDHSYKIAPTTSIPIPPHPLVPCSLPSWYLPSADTLRVVLLGLMSPFFGMPNPPKQGFICFVQWNNAWHIVEVQWPADEWVSEFSRPVRPSGQGVGSSQGLEMDRAIPVPQQWDSHSRPQPAGQEPPPALPALPGTGGGARSRGEPHGQAEFGLEGWTELRPRCPAVFRGVSQGKLSDWEEHPRWPQFPSKEESKWHSFHLLKSYHFYQTEIW